MNKSGFRFGSLATIGRRCRQIFFFAVIWLCASEATHAAWQTLHLWTFENPLPMNDSVGSANLTAVGTTTNLFATGNPALGQAVLVTNGYLSAAKGSLASLENGPFYIRMVLQLTNEPVNLSAGLLDTLTNTSTGYQMFIQSDHTVWIRLDDTSGHVVIASSTRTIHADGDWHTVELFVDRSQTNGLAFVLDGMLDSVWDVRSLTGQLTPSQDLMMGSLNGTAPLIGSLAEVEIGYGSMPTVALSPTGGSFTNSVTVSLNCTNAQAIIHYTTDGSLPTTNSPVYTNGVPLNFTQNTKLTAAAFVSAVGGPACSATYVQLPQTVPNFVIFLADDVGYGDLPKQGNPVHVTPSLNGLVTNGLRFTQFYTAGPGDWQSLYALLTGRSGARSALPPSLPPGSVAAMDAGEWTLPEALRKNGYATAFIGAWRLGPSSAAAPTAHGFSEALYLPYSPVFTPYPPLLTQSGTNNTTPDPAALLGTLTTQAQSFISAHAGVAPFFLLFHPPARCGIPTNGTYVDWMAALDSSVGQILSQLNASGVRTNTIFLFLSDNGSAMATNSLPAGSTGGLRDAKSTGWEGGLRVPCVASWPGQIPAGVESIAPWWMPDLFPTLAQLANVPVATDRAVDGVARWDVLSGFRADPLGTEQFEFHACGETNAPLLSMRVGTWKYHYALRSVDRENVFSNAVPPLLFHMGEDPFEIFELSKSNTTALAIATNAAQTWLSSLASNTPPGLPAVQPPLSSPLSVIGTNGGPFLIGFSRPRFNNGDFYWLQWSTNLATWSSVPLSPQINSTIPLSDTLESVQVSPYSLTPTPDALYYRIQYISP
jgi:arylsulfatase A-like enzyme